jgi:hypothetical protein
VLPNPDQSDFDLEWYADGVLAARMRTTATSDGFIFLCEACGYDKPWGAKYFPNRAMTKFYSACKDHPPTRGEVPGSMILWFHDEMREMPDSLVEREYNLHLAHYERTKDEKQASGDTRKAAVPSFSPASLLAELEGGAGTPNFAGA